MPLAGVRANDAHLTSESGSFYPTFRPSGRGAPWANGREGEKRHHQHHRSLRTESAVESSTLSYNTVQEPPSLPFIHHLPARYRRKHRIARQLAKRKFRGNFAKLNLQYLLDHHNLHKCSKWSLQRLPDLRLLSQQLVFERQGSE